MTSWVSDSLGKITSLIGRISRQVFSHTVRLEGTGIEIGAHDLPIPDITPFYVDRFTEFAGKRCMVDIISDAGKLPFAQNTLDYVASSHLVEHLPNPVQAIMEWIAVTRPGGLIYTVVPDARFTFDHRRERTTIQHLIDDFERQTTACDATHIDEFTANIDIDMMNLNLSDKEKLALRTRCNLSYHDEIAQGNEINIHFHVFEPENFMEMMEFISSRPGYQIELIEKKERFPESRKDGFLTVYRKL
jgi:SAM-dependent methyltransferase